MSKVYPIEDAVPMPPDEDEKKQEKKVLTKDEKI
ncbi:sucrose porin precursor [Pseudomonas syringae pv. broussonetiae]|nr:sucrose porin precursor [Pseudomonas syringae pv. broussonetiae]